VRLNQWTGLLCILICVQGCNAKPSGFTDTADAKAKDPIAPRLKRRARVVAGIDQQAAEL
jgi:hypothetical protein